MPNLLFVQPEIWWSWQPIKPGISNHILKSISALQGNRLIVLDVETPVCQRPSHGPILRHPCCLVFSAVFVPEELETRGPFWRSKLIYFWALGWSMNFSKPVFIICSTTRGTRTSSPVLISSSMALIRSNIVVRILILGLEIHWEWPEEPLLLFIAHPPSALFLKIHSFVCAMAMPAGDGIILKMFLYPRWRNGDGRNLWRKALSFRGLRWRRVSLKKLSCDGTEETHFTMRGWSRILLKIHLSTMWHGEEFISPFPPPFASARIRISCR